MNDEDIKRKLEQLEKRVKAIEKYLSNIEEFELPSNDKEADLDDLYNQALLLVLRSDTVSASSLQRKLQIGYNRAARILDQLEEKGIVGSSDNGEIREVLIKQEDIELLRKKLEDKKEKLEKGKRQN